MGGSVAASAAVDSGQPDTGPLWLNSPRPCLTGAAAAGPWLVPGVAFRTAASMALALVTPATSAKESSVQMGTACRYRTGSASSAGYQPTPNPSALIAPGPCRRGAQPCPYRPCGGATIPARSGAGRPRGGAAPAGDEAAGAGRRNCWPRFACSAEGSALPRG